MSCASSVLYHYLQTLIQQPDFHARLASELNADVEPANRINFLDSLPGYPGRPTLVLFLELLGSGWKTQSLVAPNWALQSHRS